MRTPQRIVEYGWILFLAGLLVSGTASGVSAQDTGGGGGGGGAGGGGDFGGGGDQGTGGGNIGGGTNTGNNQGGITGNQGGGGGPTNTGDFDISQLEIQQIEPDFQNERIVPFVGPSSQNITHPYSQSSGDGAAGGGTPGGTTFSFGPSGFGGGTAGGFGNSSAMTFVAPRQGIRARLSNQITTSNRDAFVSQIPVSFQRRLSRIPGLADSGTIAMSLEGTQATLSGFVRTREQKQLIERMARLEPGIYSIDNQIGVRPAGDVSNLSTPTSDDSVSQN